ncbi:serine/threonine protein kinase [Mycoplasmopsis arginini]|uniref:serine/threonine protein kinase n=1 Tax=Mycoplasmopsis arginini TaxID=2094 RepID=UPI003519D54D
MLKRLDKYDNVNKHFEDFVLIGSGGYGEVYSATFKKTGKRMAIKILTVFDATKKEVNQIRFKNECNVLKTINSKNVVRMIGYYVSENESYYAMELIKGINLRSLISKYKKIPVEEAVRIAREICEGLADIHLANVIHRDLKPSNILIESETNTVKLIDFGISLSDDSLRVTADNKTVGSVQYLAPEIPTRSQTASIQSDIYAFGMIFYEMLAGHPVYQGIDAQAVLLLQINGEIPPLEGVGKTIPQAVENIIIRCTAKNPSDRYKNCVEIISDLNHCLQPQAALEKRLDLSNKVVNKKRKISKSLTIALITLGSSAAVGLLIYLIIFLVDYFKK